jgi:hypothetical protein
VATPHLRREHAGLNPCQRRTYVCTTIINKHDNLYSVLLILIFMDSLPGRWRVGGERGSLPPLDQAAAGRGGQGPRHSPQSSIATDIPYSPLPSSLTTYPTGGGSAENEDRFPLWTKQRLDSAVEAWHAGFADKTVEEGPVFLALSAGGW